MKEIKTFFVAALPEIRFGSGKINETPEVLSRFGNKALLVTGRRSFTSTPHWQRLLEGLSARGITWEHMRVEDAMETELNR